MANNTSSISSRASKQRAESLGFLALATGVLIALNVLGVFTFFRADTTQNRAFSLSDGSRRAVRELDETLSITAYFTSDLPAPFNSTERIVRDILSEYQSAGGSHVQIRFVSPNTEAERTEANERGLQLVQHQSVESNAASVVEGYRGIVFEYLGERQTIPVIQPNTQGLEYDITMAIKRLTGERVAIGILSGHEGPTLAEGLSTLQRMLPLYEVREVNANEEISTEIRALLIIEPKNEITETELRRINQFVMRGGSLGVFGGAMMVDLATAPDLSATPTGANLNQLLRPWGVVMGENIVADAQCGRVPMRDPRFPGGGYPVPYPPAPVVSFTDEQSAHPVLFRLNSTPLFFASSIETTDAFEGNNGIVLMRSSGDENSWLLTGSSVDIHIRDPREWRATLGGASGPFALAVAVDARLPSAFEGGEIEAPAQSETPNTEDDNEVRVLVVGTSTPLRDEFLPQGDRVAEADLAGAMAFALNAVDWLAQDSDLIAIRAKTIEEPPLEVPQSIQTATDEAVQAAETGDEDATNEALRRRETVLSSENSRKVRMQFLNVLGVPVILIIFGLVRWQMRKAKRAALKA